MRINIQIERLVLDGMNISSPEHPLLQAAFVSEISRLLTQGGLNHELSSGGALPSVSTEMVRISQGNNTERFGHQLAHAVYKGIGQ